MRQIGQNTNTATEAFSQTYSIDSNTAVTIAAPTTMEDTNIEIDVTNDGNSSLWVRRRPAASDNLKDGRRLAPGETACIVTTSSLYMGEISAIFESGGFRDVMVERL